MATSKTTSAPPPIPAPPTPKPKASGERGTFNQFINAHKALKPYASLIWTWANNYGGITPSELAAAVWTNTRGKPSPKTLGAMAGTASGANAAGVPFTTTASSATPNWQLQAIAWKLSGAAETYGSVDQAYTQSYGAAGNATPVSRLLPSGYVGTAGPTATQTGTKTVTTGQVTSGIKDPWVVLTPKGTLGYVNSAEPPKNALSYGGTPITQSEFTSIWKQTYADTYFAYTGKQATGTQIAAILKQAPSVYTLSNQLAGEKSFSNSPVYKQHAPGLVAVGQSVLGNNWKPSGGIIKQAIAQNWDQATFEQHLRSSPAYLQSPEFKTNLAQNTSAFQAIYGGEATDDTAIQNDLSAKTQAGWTPDELQAWARQQPAYKQSDEYQAKATAFATNLGLITGQQATLSQDQINQMLNAGRSAAGAPYSSAGSQLRSGEGVGGALNS